MGRFDQISAQVAQYLANFRRFYPGIMEWYFGLHNEFASGRRRMFASWNRSGIRGLAITKNGDSAKLCHISVSPHARGSGLGANLAFLALRDMARCGAREIRVTTSEETYRSHGTFFYSFGFRVVDWQVHRYRRNASELLWKLDGDTMKGLSKKGASSFPEHKLDTQKALNHDTPAAAIENPIIPAYYNMRGTLPTRSPALLWECGLPVADHSVSNFCSSDRIAVSTNIICPAGRVILRLVLPGQESPLPLPARVDPGQDNVGCTAPLRDASVWVTRGLCIQNAL